MPAEKIVENMHYFNMDHVDDDSDFITVLDGMERLDGYRLVNGSATYIGINPNSRTTEENLITGLKSVALMSDAVTFKNREGLVSLRKETPGNWLWYMDPVTGKEKIYVSLQCLNAVGALDKDKVPFNGKGCSIHNGIETGTPEESHNGRVMAKIFVTKYYVPRTADVEHMTWTGLQKYTDSNCADLHLYGGWIIWEAHDSVEQLREQFGPSKFYSSGMFRFGPGVDDIQHMHLAGVRIRPDED